MATSTAPELSALRSASTRSAPLERAAGAARRRTDAGQEGCELDGWLDRRVRASHGRSLGVVVAIEVDRAAGRPVALIVDPGQFGRWTVVVPVAGASLLGDDVVLGPLASTWSTVPHPVSDWDLPRPSSASE